MGGPIFGRALMWALMCCRTQRKEDQGSVIVGGEGKTITDVAQGGIRAACLSQSLSPSDTLSDPVQMARNHLHQKARSQTRARAASSPFDPSGSCEIDNY